MSNLLPTVFISHSSKDDDIARKIEEWLRFLDFECWVYYRDVELDFRAAIHASIKSQCFFLLISSKNSLESPEVRLEIETAFKAKRCFCIYRLDEHPFPDGVGMILQSVKWIDARNHTVTTFAKLAEQMLAAIGLEKPIIVQRIATVRVKIKAQEEEEARRQRVQLEKWLDKLWTYRYDYKTRKSRPLKTWDKLKLNAYGDELGISEQDRFRYQVQYKRRLNTFRLAISTAFTGNRLDKRDIRILEKTRVDCCIPLKEAKQLVQEELTKLQGIVALTRGAAVQDSWIVALIIDSHSTQSNSKDSGNYNYQILEDSETIDNNVFAKDKQRPTPVSTNITTDHMSSADLANNTDSSQAGLRKTKITVSEPTAYSNSPLSPSHDKKQASEPIMPSTIRNANEDSIGISAEFEDDLNQCADRDGALLFKFASETVTLDQYFLGRYICSCQIQAISFDKDEFIFIYDDHGLSKRLYPTRRFTEVSVYCHQIVIKQEGHKNYYTLHIESHSLDFSRLHDYLRGCGLTVIFRNSKVGTSSFRHNIDGSKALIEGGTSLGSKINNAIQASGGADEISRNLQMSQELATVTLQGSLIDESESYIHAIKALKLSARLEKLCQFKPRIFEPGSIAVRPFSIDPKLASRSTFSNIVYKSSRGTLLLCFIDSRIIAKRGIIVFERGFEIADDANADFFLFGHPDVSPESMVSIGVGKQGRTEITVRGYSLLNQAILSRTFLFKSPLLSRETDFRLGLIDLLIGLNESQKMMDQLHGCLFERLRGLTTWNLLLGFIGPNSPINTGDKPPLWLSSFANGGPSPSRILFFLGDLSIQLDVSCLIIALSGLYFKGRTSLKSGKSTLLYWPWSDINSFRYRSLGRTSQFKSFCIGTSSGLGINIYIRKPSVGCNNLSSLSVEDDRSCFDEISTIIMELKTIFFQLSI